MMTAKALITPAALLATLALVTAPAWAGQRDHGSNRSGQGSGRAGERSQGQRSESPRADTGRSQPRQEATPQRSEPQRDAGSQRSQQQRDAGSQRSEPRRDVAVPRAQPPRQAIAPRYDQRDDRSYDQRNGGYGQRNDRRYEPFYAPRYSPRYDWRNDWRYSYSYRPHYLYRQPYLFRPWFTIGFGTYAGYPVPYTYAYPYPVYGYSAPSGPVVVGPGSTVYGGATLDIRPSDAEVYVDGGYAGQVKDFDGAAEPLTLATGTHRIEIVAVGYETLTIDIDVAPGQIIPYRGELRRLPY